MPSQQHRPEEAAGNAAFTLSFGGVDFRLTPCDASDRRRHRHSGSKSDGDRECDGGNAAAALVSVPEMGGGERRRDMVLRLESFTGTLRVALSSFDTDAGAESTPCPASIADPTADATIDASDATPSDGATVVADAEADANADADANDDVDVDADADGAAAVVGDRTPRGARENGAPGAVTPSAPSSRTNTVVDESPPPPPSLEAAPRSSTKSAKKAAARSRGQQKLSFCKKQASLSRNSSRKSKRGAPSKTTEMEDSTPSTPDQSKKKMKTDGGGGDETATALSTSLGQTMPSQCTALSQDDRIEDDRNAKGGGFLLASEDERSRDSLAGDRVWKSKTNSADRDDDDTAAAAADELGSRDVDESMAIVEEEGGPPPDDEKRKGRTDGPGCPVPVPESAAAPISNAFARQRPSPKRRSDDPHPCARWGQTMSMIDHQRFVVYGGQTLDPETGEGRPLSDLHVYDLSDRRWTRPINCDGVPRAWHTANFLPDRQLLISFGGDAVHEKTGRTFATDQVMVLDTEIMLWYPPSVTGSVPSGRSGHTASLLGNSNDLVVFGGVRDGKWLHSVSVLDTHRWKWTIPKIFGNAPRPRCYHTATPVTARCGGDGGDGTGNSDSDGGGEMNRHHDRIVIFGGNDGTKCFNSVHVLEAPADRGRRWTWSHPKVSGIPPAPRTGHIAVLLDDNRTVAVHGGWDPNFDEADDGEEKIYGDCFLLDTHEWTWRKGPKPRFLALAKTSAAATAGVAAAGNGGAKRVGHSAVLAPGAEGSQVLTFGGRLPGDDFAADFQSLVAPQREMIARKGRGGG